MINDKEIDLFLTEIKNECIQKACTDCKYHDFCNIGYAPLNWGTKEADIVKLVIKAWEQRKNKKQIRIKKIEVKLR